MNATKKSTHLKEPDIDDIFDNPIIMEIVEDNEFIVPFISS
jgi:hypothetical protein